MTKMITLSLTEAECRCLVDLLDQAADTYSNHGCNDYPVPANPENRELAESIAKWNGEEDYPANGDPIYLTDYQVMRYLKDRIAQETSP